MTHQRFSDMDQALKTAGLDPKDYIQTLDQCSEFFSRYAGLENTLLGEVPLTFPAHLLEHKLPTEPVEAGEFVATKEIERLGNSMLGLDGLQVFLDREQLKVFRFQAPEDAPLAGFFLFDPTWGPIFAVNASLDMGESDRVLATLYGHFLMDKDPYQIQFVFTEPREPSVSGLRAAAFALALLIPKEALVEYLSALSVEPKDLGATHVESLAVYFGVSPLVVALRLVSLGWISPGNMQALALGASTGDSAWERYPDSVFGDRFVLLALEAHAREAIDLDTLVAYLQTTKEEALSWMERFQLDIQSDTE